MKFKKTVLNVHLYQKSILNEFICTFFMCNRISARALRSISGVFILLFFSASATLAQAISITNANSSANGITQGSLTLGQKNLVLFGFGLTVNEALTISEFNIDITSPDSRNNYFSNFRLYRSADSVHSTDDMLVNSTTVWKKNNLNNLNISALSETFEGTTPKTFYYFLLADYTGSTGTVPGTIQFNFSTIQKANAIITSIGNFTGFNTPGTNFTTSPPSVTVSNENNGTNGITPSLITFNQKGIVLFGFGVTVKGTSTISQFNITSSNSIGSYFSNGKLYRSSDNIYSSDDTLIASVSINKGTSTTLGISNLTESFDWSPTRYYFFVADYTTNGPVLNNTIQFKFSSGQASEAIIQSIPQKYTYNNFDVAGQTFVFARTTIWLGNSLINPSDWNNAENWSGGYVPGNTDIAYIGTQSFLTQPVVQTNASIGSIHLGTAQAVILTVDTAASLNAGDIIQKTTDASIINTITGAGNILVNNFQLTDPTSNPIFTANRTSKIISSISSLTANNIIIRSKTNGFRNDAAFEIPSGTASIKGSVQTINAAVLNMSTFISDSGSVISLTGSTPFYLSSTGSNVINHQGLTNYNGATAQSVSTAVNYKDLMLTGSGVKTIEANISKPFNLWGNLSIISPATIAYSSNITAINLGGNFEGNATLNPGSLPVNISGNWTNSLSESIAGTVTYNGATDQIVAGMDYVNINFSNGGTKTLVNPASVKGNIEVGPNTIFNTNDRLTLKADSAGNANINPLFNGADIFGKVNIQSFIKGGKRGFLALSSPVYDTTSVDQSIKAFTFVQLKKHLPVTGYGSTVNGFDQGAIVNPDGPTIRMYQEQAAPWQNQYYNPGHISETIERGRGFFFFFRGDRSNIYYKVNPPFNTPENVLMEYSGYINKGDITSPLSYTYYSSTTDNGFNLIGNPYPSTIDLQKLLEGTSYNQTWILKQNNTYAVYDVGLGTGTNGASRYVIPGQAFFIQANQAGQAITFTENCKASTISTTRIMSDKVKPLATISALSRKTAYKQLVTLKAKKSGSDFEDETIIVFKDGSSDNRTTEDANYLGEAPVLLGSLSNDNKLLAINYLPNVITDTEVKLTVGGEETGTYSLNLTSNIPTEFSDILLLDRYLKKTISLKAESTYAFFIDKSSSDSFGDERFKLIFKRASDETTLQTTLANSIVPENKTAINLLLYPNPVVNELHVELNKRTTAVKMEIFNLQGRTIKSSVFNSPEKLVQNVSDLTKGAYILKVVDPESDNLIGLAKFIKE